MPASSSDRTDKGSGRRSLELSPVSKAFYTPGPMLRDVATRAEHAAKRQEKRRAAAIPQASYTITCPSCSHEWNTLKVGRRARTCPKCGHAGPRAAFAERLTATNGSTPPEPPAEGATVATTKPNGEDHKIKRKLAGAAAAAHAAKERGEPVTVGNAGRLRGMKRARPASSSSSSSSSSTTTRTPAKPVGILERLKRVVI